jgi:hypothetical protein
MKKHKELKIYLKNITTMPEDNTSHDAEYSKYIEQSNLRIKKKKQSYLFFYCNQKGCEGSNLTSNILNYTNLNLIIKKSNKSCIFYSNTLTEQKEISFTVMEMKITLLSEMLTKSCSLMFSNYFNNSPLRFNIPRYIQKQIELRTLLSVEQQC